MHCVLNCTFCIGHIYTYCNLRGGNTPPHIDDRQARSGGPPEQGVPSTNSLFYCSCCHSWWLGRLVCLWRVLHVLWSGRCAEVWKKVWQPKTSEWRWTLPRGWLQAWTLQHPLLPRCALRTDWFVKYRYHNTNTAWPCNITLHLFSVYKRNHSLGITLTIT